MTHFIQLNPIVHIPGAPAGRPVVLQTSPDFLFHHGVMMQIQLSTGSLFCQIQKIPIQSIVVWGLLDTDTGCKVSSIDQSVAKAS